MRRLAAGTVPFVFVLVVALAAGSTSLGNGFAYDDLHLVVHNPAAQSLATWPDRFGETYWPPVPLGPAGRLYRPLTVIGFSLQWALGGGSPLVFHITSVLLYALISLLVLALAVRFLPIGPATLAAAIFAAHPVHVEAVANVVGQGELLAGALGLLALVLAVDALRSGLTFRRRLAVLGCFLLACLAKEHAILIPALLVLLLPCLVALDRPELRRGVMTLCAGLAVVGAGYLLLRRSVVGAGAGDLPHTFWRGVSAGDRWLTVLGEVPTWARLALFPLRLSADYAPREVTLATRFGGPQVVGLLLLLAGLALATWGWRRSRLVTAGIAWTVLALLPTSNLLFPSGIVLSERTLFLPSVGAVLAAGAVAAWWGRTRGEGFRVAVGALAVLGITAGTFRSALRGPVWRDNTTLFTATLSDAPESYWAWRNWAGDLVLRGRYPVAAAAYERSLSLFDKDPQVYDDRASLARRTGHCEVAIPLYRRALELDSTRGQTAVRLIGCLSSSGRFDEARSEARSRAHGPQAAAFAGLVSLVDSAERAAHLRGQPTQPAPSP